MISGMIYSSAAERPPAVSMSAFAIVAQGFMSMTGLRTLTSRVWKLRFFPLLALLLGGCHQVPTAEQEAALSSYNQEMGAQARAKKISWSDYARLTNAQVQNMYAGDPRLAEADAQAALAYRISLASEIDAGRSTPERFNYDWQQFIANAKAVEAAERSAALARASTSPVTPVAAGQPQQGFDCTSTPIEAVTNTSC
jgi:hypothetical protein